jgi:nucleoside 2-deoxyribosyltransferase
MAGVHKGKLEGACCYLSGPMEFVADHGVEWRRKFIRLSKEAGLKIDYIDPTNKPGGQDVKIGENKEYQATLQREGKWHMLKNYVQSYRRYDLRFVDLSDFLVAVIDPTIPQWGTSNEIYVAETQHKPTFFIIEGGLAKLPRWLFGVVDLDNEILSTRCNVFDSVEAVISELVELDTGSLPMTNEWVLVRKHIERARMDG